MTDVARSSFNYDDAARLKLLLHDKPNSAVTFDRFDLSYDTLGRITSVVTTPGIPPSPNGPGLAPFTTNFNYDKTDQLTAATGVLPGRDDNYNYDTTGNRTSTSTTTGGQTTGQTYAPAQLGNRLSSDGKFAYSYDAEGNMTRKTQLVPRTGGVLQPTGESTFFTWDHRNRLVHVERRATPTVNAAGQPTGAFRTAADYAFDAFDRRIAKTVDPDGIPNDEVGLYWFSAAVGNSPAKWNWLQDRDHNGKTIIPDWGHSIPGGQSQDKAVAGDWDGDGDTNVGIYRPSTSQWFLDIDGDGAFNGPTDRTVTFNGPSGTGLIALAGDWNGDRTADLGLYRYNASSGLGEFYQYADGQPVPTEPAVTVCAQPGDKPVAGDWDGDGDDNVGLYRFGGNVGTWLLETDNVQPTCGVFDRTWSTGTFANRQPVVGDWDGTGDDNLGFYFPGRFQRFIPVGDVMTVGDIYFGNPNIASTPLSGNWDGAGGQRTYRESYIYDGPHILLEFSDPDASGPQPSALRSRLLYGPAIDMLLADEQFTTAGGVTTSTILWPLTDWLGSVRDLVQLNSSTLQPEIKKHTDYDSFGNFARVTDGSGQPTTFDAGPSTRAGYTGRPRDPETGLLDYRGRVYDAAIAQFLSEDPSGFGGGDFNLRRYVSNDPVNWVDPDGFQQQRPTGAGGTNWADQEPVDQLLRRDGKKLRPGSLPSGIDRTPKTGADVLDIGKAAGRDMAGHAIKELAPAAAGMMIPGAGNADEVLEAGAKIANPGRLKRCWRWIKGCFVGEKAAAKAATAIKALPEEEVARLVQASDGKVVKLFSKLDQAPEAGRQLSTALDPKLAEQIKHGQMYVGEIPELLYKRLQLEQHIQTIACDMNGVVGTEIRITAEGMDILKPYFK